MQGSPSNHSNACRAATLLFERNLFEHQSLAAWHAFDNARQPPTPTFTAYGYSSTLLRVFKQLWSSTLLMSVSKLSRELNLLTDIQRARIFKPARTRPNIQASILRRVRTCWATCSDPPTAAPPHPNAIMGLNLCYSMQLRRCLNLP